MTKPAKPRKSTGRPTGRPTLRTDAIVDEICERVTRGETLASVCRQEHMPHLSTVYDWCAKDSDLSRRVARARDDGGDAIADDALRIADDRDDDPASRRVRVETRLKLLACWHPKRYGQRTTVAGDAENPVRAELTVNFVAAKPDG